MTQPNDPKTPEPQSTENRLWDTFATALKKAQPQLVLDPSDQKHKNLFAVFILGYQACIMELMVEIEPAKEQAMKKHSVE